MLEPKKNIVFVCYTNICRSRNLTKYIGNILNGNGNNYNVTSAGIFPLSSNRINGSMCQKADIIFVMEKYIQDHIIKKYGADPSKVINLDIPNVYWPNGDFSSILAAMVFFKNGTARTKELIQRPEIRQKLSLDKVLETRGLKQLILENSLV